MEQEYRLVSKAKKASPATAKSNPNKKSKFEVKASSSQKSIGINNATAPINYYCGGCGELYENSHSDWLQCVECLECMWEIDCSETLGKSKEQDQFCCPDCE